MVRTIDEDAEKSTGEVILVDREDRLKAVAKSVGGVDGVAFVGEGLGENLEEIGSSACNFVIKR